MADVNLKSLIQKLNPVCQKALEAAAGLCLSRSHYNIEIEHWLLKLLESSDNDIAIILSKFEIDTGRLIYNLNCILDRLKTGNAQPPVLSQRIVDLVKKAWLFATLELNVDIIRSVYLLHALLREESLNRIATSMSPQFAKLSADALKAALPGITGNSIENLIIQNDVTVTENLKTPALNQFTVDLTEQARLEKIDQVIGRDTEIRQMVDVLMRRRQNNPILTGEPGVGKTAIVEGFALRVANGDVPPPLKNVAVHTLDLGLLQAGAGIKGEFENRLKSVINEIKASEHPIILFVDEAHTLIGAGAQSGQGDAANLLKPALARGELRTIAATTWAEYKKYFEQDAALARRFQAIKIDEPTEENAINMLRSLVTKLEEHHQVRILDEAIIAAVRLSNRYLPERQLPDKAISILDTACARLATSDASSAHKIEILKSKLVQLTTEINLLKREEISGANHGKKIKVLIQQDKTFKHELETLQARWHKEFELINAIRSIREKLELLQENKSKQSIKLLQQQLKQLSTDLLQLQGEAPMLQDSVDAQAVAEVISAWTGIPLGRMMHDDIHTALNLEQNLQKRIIGQDYALQCIAQNIRTSRAQLTDPNKPTGVFLFVGPSGVGKTETAHALAEQLYGSDQNMTVINMSEFKEEHKVSLLLGSPPGYVGYGSGGLLTEAVRRKPYSLVLLDEIEKAHRGIQDIFYQVFDKGVLRDGQGCDVNFKNTIIILTSNVGADLIAKMCSDPEKIPDMSCVIEHLKPELLKVFKPAFLGRVTIVPYLTLSDAVMHNIISLKLQRIEQRFKQNHQANFSYSTKLIKHILQRCNEVDTGVRNVDHVLSRSLLPDISTKFLTALVNGKGMKKIHVDVNEVGRFEYQVE